MFDSIYLSGANYKYSDYSTSERTYSGLCLLSTDNGNRDSFNLDLFFIPLQCTSRSRVNEHRQRSTH
jgi:hypothetical protein